MLADWEAQQDDEPRFDVETHKIDGKPFVRVTFPDGKEETIYGFNVRQRPSAGSGARPWCGSLEAAGT
jgi:hypothetical protein